MDKTADLLAGPAENLESEIGGDRLHLLRWENLPVTVRGRGVKGQGYPELRANGSFGSLLTAYYPRFTDERVAFRQTSR